MERPAAARLAEPVATSIQTLHDNGLPRETVPVLATIELASNGNDSFQSDKTSVHAAKRRAGSPVDSDRIGKKAKLAPSTPVLPDNLTAVSTKLPKTTATGPSGASTALHEKINGDEDFGKLD